MTNVASHAGSSDPRSNIANATIEEDLGALFDDDSETTVNDILPSLRQTINNLVSDTSGEDDEAADYDELEEQFEEDIETVDTRIETLRSQYIEQVEDHKQWANDLERELLSEPDRLGNARSYLNQCYSALEVSNDELPEAGTFSKSWRQWQEREPKIKEDLLENEKVISRIPDFVEDINGEDIALATDTDVPEVIDQLSNEEFKQLLEGTTHEQLQAYFMAQRVLQSMDDDERDEDEREQPAEVDQ
jgi:hypothetical protein